MKQLNILIIFLFLNSYQIVAFPQDNSSLNMEDEFETDLYENNLLKFKHLILTTKLDSSFKVQTIPFIKQFTNLAKSENYAEANIIIESVISMIQIYKDQYSLDTTLLATDSKQLTEKQNFSWIGEITTGSDLWRQEFELSIPGSDSTIVSDNFNPFINFDLGVNYNSNTLKFYLNGNYKNSRDYHSSNFNLNFNKQITDKLTFKLNNQFENTTYTDEIELAYWQNELTTNLITSRIGILDFEIENRFLIKRNDPESTNYSDYNQNRFRLISKYMNSRGLLFKGDYRFEKRIYPVYDYKDYQEHQLGLNNVGLISNLYINFYYSFRDYTANYNDTTFYNDYDEIEADMNWTCRINNLISFRISNYFESRKYDNMNSITINYTDAKINPELIFDIKDLWTVEAGYIYNFRKYSDTNSSSILEEDYYSNGLSISINLLQLNNFTLSINDTYSFKRYPKSEANEIDYFTLYTDRNINSILCFCSWNIVKHIELGLIANYDTDRDPYEENSDAKNTMFSMDLRYRF